jgi:cobalt-zinc-cadmium efflux system protein
MSDHRHQSILRLSSSLILNVLLAVGLVVAGRIAHSTGLLADAGHNLTDAMAIVLALVASFMAQRPPSPRRSFGSQRSTILAALANGIVLVAVTVSIVVVSVARLIHPTQVRGGIVIVAASASLLVNLIVVGLLRGDARELSVKSALIHSLGDALSAGVVLGAGIVTALAHGPIAERVDPVASLIVATFIVVEAVRLSGSSLHILLEGVPSDIDLDEVRRCLCGIEGVVEVHDLHVWSLSSTERALSAHVVIEGDPALSATRRIVYEGRTELARRFAIGHVTLEVEARACADPDGHR